MKMDELKPAIKTLEGKIVATALASCIPILGYLTGAEISVDDVETAKEVAGMAAEKISDVQAWWKMTQNVPAELTKFGKFGSVLFFMYKLATFYITKRTDIKIALINMGTKDVQK